MDIFVIITNYLDSGFFGTYSTVKRARIVLEKYFNIDDNIVAFMDNGDYSYRIFTQNGAEYYAEICYQRLDAEYESGMIKEDE